MNDKLSSVRSNAVLERTASTKRKAYLRLALNATAIVLASVILMAGIAIPPIRIALVPLLIIDAAALPFDIARVRANTRNQRPA